MDEDKKKTVHTFNAGTGLFVLWEFESMGMEPTNTDS